MTKTVFFHIGSVKTGSTSLQKFCYCNREALSKMDVEYIQFEPPRIDLPRWANADYIDHILDADFDTDFVAEKINTSPASRILISEEGLMARPHVWQHPVFRNMCRVVILYLRNSVELVASWASENSLPYNFGRLEHSSGRGVVSIDEGISFWSSKYRAILFNIYNAFGSDSELNLIIREFPPPNQEEENLTEGFLKLLGINEGEARNLAGNGNEEVINAGRSRKYCDVAYFLSELVHEYDVPDLYGEAMVEELCERLKSGDDRKAIDTLSKVEIKFIHNRLAAPSEALVYSYGAPESIMEMSKAFYAKNAPYSSIDLKELRHLFFEYVVRMQEQTIKKLTQTKLDSRIQNNH